MHNVIRKPSRVISSSQTSIDAIFTISTSVKSALSIMDDISDHLPIFWKNDISFKITQIPTYTEEEKSR